MVDMTTHHLTILTGASRGMGLAMAQQLLRPGHALVCISRHRNPDLASLAARAGATLEQWEQDLSQGAYFGGRKAEDGRINWQQSALQIHNLVRAVAPPYPGAFADISGQRVSLLRTRRLNAEGLPRYHAPTLFVWQNQLFLQAADGNYLAVLSLQLNQQTIDPSAFAAHFGTVFTL